MELGTYGVPQVFNMYLLVTCNYFHYRTYVNKVLGSWAYRSYLGYKTFIAGFGRIVGR